MKLQLQSSVGGNIRRLLLVDVSEKEELRPSFRSILLALYREKSAHTQLVVWSNSHRTSLEMEDWLKGSDGNMRTTRHIENTSPSEILMLSPLGVGAAFSIERWARDMFLVFRNGLQGSGKSILKTTANLEYLLSFDLKDHHLVEDVQFLHNIDFSGGDVLSDGHYIFIGQNTIEKTIDVIQKEFGVPFGDMKQEATRRIADQFGVSIDSIVGITSEGPNSEDEFSDLFKSNNWFHQGHTMTGAQLFASSFDPDLPHIDLFLTPTGVASANDPKKPVVLLARLLNCGTENGNLKVLNTKLDKLARQLGTKFSVLRNVVPCVTLPRSGWVYLFYNNCLVENSTDLKAVWLPCYLCSFEDESTNAQIREAQNCNEQIWRALGFDVRFIQADFVPISGLKGSLHCLTNEIERY